VTQNKGKCTKKLAHSIVFVTFANLLIGHGCYLSMVELRKIEAPVSEELKCFLEDFESSLRTSTPLLQDAVDIILHSNGKHVRPLLVLLTAKACGQITNEAINSAVLLELLHTATLLHDDVIDETKQRRGVPSLNAIFDNRVAVLTGDFILSASVLRSIQSGNLRVVSIVSGLGKELSEGELAQLDTAEKIILNEECYFEVIRKKTAALLSACTEIGSISSGANEDTIALCKAIGENLGYCFQIKDDIFDYDKKAKVGKPTGNDIREGKITLPLLHALKTAPKEESSVLLDIINTKDYTEKNIDFLISFAKQYNGIEYAEKRMREYYTKAVELINQLPESEARQSLFLLADYIIERTK